jgi:hypothetical protein
MSRSSAFRVRVPARAAWLISVLGALCGAALAAPQQWPIITEAERTFTQVPGQPGAPAAYLCREVVSDWKDRTYREFNRLKILTAAGKEYGTIEIPFTEAWPVVDITARVRRPDGRFAPFTGEIFEKTAFQSGRFKYLVKTFALPDLDVGSIIEYSYELKFDPTKSATSRSLNLERWEPEEGGETTDGLPLSIPVERWDLNAPLYTFKAKFTHIPFKAGVVPFKKAMLRLIWVSYGLTWGPPEMKDGRVVLEVGDIPARSKEEFSPPEDEGRMGVVFFFCDTMILKAEHYWLGAGESWQAAVAKFLKGSDGIAEESRTVTAGLAAPREKLAALYARAQSIKNLSYDPKMTPMRRKELDVKDNRNAGDVLKRNAGLRSDITRTFVALARAAGFRADVARAATRDDKLFHENVLDLYGQLDTELAIVMVDGREDFYDPATPGCPFGLLRWSATDTTYVRSSGPPGVFATIPPDPPERTEMRQTLHLNLDRGGRLAGSGTIVSTGQEALALRLEYLGTDEAEARKSLDAKITALLPEGGSASVRKVENLAGSNDELRIEFEVALPAATAAGDRLLLPVLPYKARGRDSFQHAGRTGSVCFPFLFRAADEITITLPEGLKVETAPAPAQSSRSFGDYALTVAVEDGSKIHVRRGLTVSKSAIPAGQFPVVKSFFDQARAGDDAMIVLSIGKK